jgi:hypothetical protein
MITTRPPKPLDFCSYKPFDPLQALNYLLGMYGVMSEELGQIFYLTITGKEPGPSDRAV